MTNNQKGKELEKAGKFRKTLEFIVIVTFTLILLYIIYIWVSVFITVRDNDEGYEGPFEPSLQEIIKISK